MSDDRPDAALESRVLEVVRALAAELPGLVRAVWG